MENFESGISEEKRKSIKLAADYVCNEFDKLVHANLSKDKPSNDEALNNETSKDNSSNDETLSKEEKSIKISELLDENEATKAYFSDLKELENDYLNKNITEEEFKQRLEEQKKKAFEKISDLREDAYATVAEKEERENCKERLRSIGVNEEIVENMPSFQIDEVIKNFSSPTINEDFLETLDDLNLPRKDADKIKKQYQYKVEGKITSGLGELDTFLGMIQPGLDLILKTGAKLFYEGIVDNVEKKFLGNEEQGVKSDFAVWAENKDALKKSYDFLHQYGNLPETDTFKYRTNTRKDENHVATYFNQMVIDKINENRKNDMDKYTASLDNYNKLKAQYDALPPEEQEKMEEPTKPSEPLHKGEEFKENPFDETKDISETRFALQDIITDVIRASRDKDENGKPIAKPTDKGKADLEAIGHLLDLFNKKNSPEFKDQFSNLAEYYKDGYTEKYSGRFVENEDYTEYEKQQKEEQKRYQAMLGDKGLDFISEQIAQGNSK